LVWLRRATVSMVTAASRTIAVQMACGRGAESEQLQAVVDDRDDEPAEHGAEHLAPAAEQADPADDRGGHGVQDVLPAVDVAGDRAELGSADDAHDASGEPRQREREDPDPAQVDAGPPGRLGVAADAGQ
jgi:hypothetical protein